MKFSSAKTPTMQNTSSEDTGRPTFYHIDKRLVKKYGVVGGGRCGGFENYVVGKDMTQTMLLTYRLIKPSWCSPFIGVYPISYQGS